MMIGIIISVLTVIVNLVTALWVHKQTNKYYEHQIKVSEGEFDTQLLNSIRDSIQHLTNTAILNFNSDEKTKKDAAEAAFVLAEEMVRMTYENACSKYLDGKINKENFKRIQKTMICERIVEGAYKDKYEKNNTPYMCTRKVYDEWKSEGTSGQ